MDTPAEILGRQVRIAPLLRYLDSFRRVPSCQFAGAPPGRVVMISTIAVLNCCDDIPDADVRRWVVAINRQLREHFAPLWGRSATLGILGRETSQEALAGLPWLGIFQDPDIAGFLGYHDETPGRLPVGKVFKKADDLYGKPLSNTLSHEALEMTGNPDISDFYRAPNGDYHMIEVADPVQGDAYQIDGVEVSNFVTPAYFGRFNADGSTKFDYLRRLSKPCPELTHDGYIMVAPAGQPYWKQVWGARGPRYADLPRLGSRRERWLRKRAGGDVFVSAPTSEIQTA